MFRGLWVIIMCFLTFHHDHVDIDGANGRLGQTLPFLQNIRDLPRGDAVVRFASKCHQLPDGHSCRRRQRGRDGKVRQRATENTISRQIRGRKMQMQEAGFQLIDFFFLPPTGMSRRNTDVCTCRRTTKTLRQTPTITPHVTLMGELPVVDALQRHPLNRHLRRQRQRDGKSSNSTCIYLQFIHLHLIEVISRMLSSLHSCPIF